MCAFGSTRDRHFQEISERFTSSPKQSAGYSLHIEIVIGTKSRTAKTRHASEQVPFSEFHKPLGIHSRIREFAGHINQPEPSPC
jgi:hypothetical protein